MTRLWTCLLMSCACYGITAPDQPLRTLRAQHPRLIALDSDIARIKSVIARDKFAADLYTALGQSGDRILGEAPVVHRLIGPRLLDQSRRALDRVYTLSLLYRLSGERKYLDRAVREMRAAAAFPDWNPKHFLDTAEMTHALAIGYDWLYASLSAEDRAVIRKAIVEKGIDQAIPVYKANRWWAKAVHNWNQVCNGGISIGALAVAEDEKEKADYVLKQGIASIQLAMASYGPEGGWAEGPGYWHYATRYNVYYLASLETALGADFGLSKIQGFPEAGIFRLYFEGPSGDTFNYADAGARTGNAEEMFWLARKFRNPVFAWNERRQLEKRERAHALDLVWYEPEVKSPKTAAWPLSRMFRGVDVAFLRSDWEDPAATWLAIKGGDNQANHSHLDLGAFVLDAQGVRWTSDLGGDNYNLPNYFGDKRWTYFRLRTEAHNTPVIGGQNQDPKAAAPMRMEGGVVRIDLKAAYPAQVTRFERSAWLADKVRAVVRDEIEAPQPVDVAWGITTAADVAIKGRRAELTRDRRDMIAEILSPEGAVFEVASATPPEPQNQNKGYRRLMVRLPGKVTRSRIEVSFTPVQKGLPVRPEPSPRRKR
jgi:hypothetical protein